jgi:hypothetical protein
MTETDLNKSEMNCIVQQGFKRLFNIGARYKSMSHTKNNLYHVE